MKIAKLILHYNTPEQTLRLAAQVPEAIIIDNGSDIPMECLTDKNKVITFDENLGFTKNWNRAIEYVMHDTHNEYEAVWLMNSDIEISRSTIDRVTELMDADFFSMITPSYNCWMKDCKNNQTQDWRRVKCIEFTAPVIRLDVIKKLGPFNETFSKGYGVELDWAIRMKDAGYEMFCDDGSVFYHHGQQTIKTMGTLSRYEDEAKIELNQGMTRLYGEQWKEMVAVELNVHFGKPPCKRVAVYTTIFNDYSCLYPVPKQSVDADYYCITDEKAIEYGTAFGTPENGEPWRILSVSYPNANLHPRMRAKFFKIFPGELAQLSNYDTVIYIDGSIQITSPDFVRFMIDSLKDGEMALYAHPQRDCIYDEAEHSRDLIKYKSQNLEAQIQAYEQFHEKHSGLWACGVMIRKIHAPAVKAVMNAWWWENVKWTYQDQISFPVVCYLLHFLPRTIPGNQYRNPFFKINWHDDSLSTKKKK